jgi:acetyltransferase-like isoleucine patch superfamily enzyme
MFLMAYSFIEGESIMKQPWKDSGVVKICEGTFIGHVVKFGKYCIVGAGGAVTKSFEDYFLIARNPAKLLKKENNNLNEKYINYRRSRIYRI